MFARVDRLRGVHKPPANEVLEGVCDVAEALDDAAHGDLNEQAINAIRAIPGRGVLVLGARTLEPDIRVALRQRPPAVHDDRGDARRAACSGSTFEPNNPRLWREVDRAVRGFLERLYRAGMLDGATSERGLHRALRRDHQPARSADDGRVTCVIGLQPPYPAEFVVVRIGVTRSGIQVEEKGAQDV